MLQALKLDAPSAPPPRNREPEAEPSGLEAGFAAFLAQAAGFLPAPPGSPPAASEPAKSTEFQPRDGRPGTERPQSQDPTSRQGEIREANTEPPVQQTRPEVEAQVDSPEAVKDPGLPSEAPAQNLAAPGRKDAAASLNLVHAEASAAAGPTAPATTALPQAAPRVAPGAGLQPLAHPPQPEGAKTGIKTASLASLRPAEALELNLRVEPEAARSWSATGLALRPLQEFLAQPRPPLETPAPLREAAPPPPQSPSEGQHGAPAPSTAAHPQPEPASTGTTVLQQAAVTARASLAANQESPSRSALAAAPTAGAVGAAAPLEAPQALARTRTALPAFQVEGSIRWMLQNRQRGAELHLHPESLGRVTIRLTVEGTEVHARVWASEASTLPLLQEHRTHLEQSLRDQGLSLGSFDLNQGSRGDASPESHKPQPRMAPVSSVDPGAPQQDLPTPEPVLPGGARLLEVFA